MVIPKKGLRHSQLKYLTKTALDDSSHQTYKVTFEENGKSYQAFFKKLAPQGDYPELLAKMSVAASSFKRLFQGNRSAEERLVFDDNDNLIGTISIGVANFKPFHYAIQGVPVNSSLREEVAPSMETLIEKNINELLVGRWFLGDDDGHPHNMSLEGDIDFDMFFYWFIIHMKGPRPGIGILTTGVTLTVRDYECFPDISDARFYHWATYQHPGEKSLPQILPGQEQALTILPIVPKAFAAPEEFRRLAQNSVAHEQKFAAVLKALLTFEPELQRRRLTELFGDLTLNYTSLDKTNPSLRAKYEQLYPHLCNSQTNARPFVDFMMDLYQKHYDSLYRVAVFYMGCSNNGRGVSLLPTYLSLYQKPSFYRKIEEWVKKENETNYAQEAHLKYDLEALQKRYHQVWRDAFAPIINELVQNSYRLTNSLLKEATNPPYVQISERISKKVTDNTLTNAWELFGNIPVFSAEAITAKICVDKDSKLRDALCSLVAFINEFHKLIKAYYEKERQDLTEEDNLQFSIKLSLLHQRYNLKIRQALANTTTYAKEFQDISESLKLIAEQVNFQLHMTTTDELMKGAILVMDRKALPFTHDEVKKQYHDALFVWAKSLKPEDLESYIVEIIDTKYAPILSMLSYRQRGELVKDYLQESAQESGDSRLAFILSSGTKPDGALNVALIRGLTPLMLQKYRIPSIKQAIEDNSFENGISDVTKDVVSFVKKDKRFTHTYAPDEFTMVFRTIYDWVDTLTEKSFKSLISSSLKTYENQKSYFWTTSRRGEVEKYMQEDRHKTSLALIFKNGDKTSSFNEILFEKIITELKKDIVKNPDILEKEQRKAIEQFNMNDEKIYLKKIKYHPETRCALIRQPQLALLM